MKTNKKEDNSYLQTVSSAPQLVKHVLAQRLSQKLFGKHLGVQGQPPTPKSDMVPKPRAQPAISDCHRITVLLSKF
eukprot:915617-Amphidinium_carterae.1